MMKSKLLMLIAIVFCASANVNAQLGVDFHQSNLPFVGVHYQMGEKFIPEVRFNSDTYFEDVSVEFDLNFILKKNEEFEFYSGFGVKFGDLNGVVIPAGLNIYPFEQQNFGFQMEVAGILAGGSLDGGGSGGSILRGSWGIRYRFK